MDFVQMKYPSIPKQLAYILYLTSWLNTTALTNFIAFLMWLFEGCVF